MNGGPPETDLGERLGGTDEDLLPGGPKRKLVENPNVVRVGFDGGDGGGSSIGKEGREGVLGPESPTGRWRRNSKAGHWEGLVASYNFIPDGKDHRDTRTCCPVLDIGGWWRECLEG